MYILIFIEKYVSSDLLLHRSDSNVLEAFSYLQFIKIKVKIDYQKSYILSLFPILGEC